MPESSIGIQERKKGIAHWLPIVFCGLLIVLIGWLRERYILNFFLEDVPFLMPRGKPNLESYPLNFHSFFHQVLTDPRWLTSILLNGAMMVCSAVIVWKWFGNKTYFWLVVFAYLFLTGVSGGLVCLSLLLNDYSAGYSVAQQLKNLLQLPFLLILFIPVLTLYEKGVDL